jgi:putative transposase
VNFVFVAKYSRSVLDAGAVDVPRGIFAGVCSDARVTLEAIDGEDDHVHLLVEYPPKVAVASLVNRLKGVPSRLLRQQRSDIRKRYWRRALVASYCASSCGGAPIGIVRQYIEHRSWVTGITKLYGTITMGWLARVMTDTAGVYKKMKVGGAFSSHETVHHSTNEYARGDVTTNSVEGDFGIFKCGLFGTYQHCGESRPHRYLAEFDFL